MLRGVSFKRASENDAAEISSILIESAKWLQRKGQESWEIDDLGVEMVKPDILAGNYFLVFLNEVTAGCFRYQIEDPEYWGDVPHEDSHFIHRVAVRRSLKGKGVASLILDFAKKRAKSKGKKYLRLDCIDRPKLRAVYESEGFEFHSVKERSPYNVIRYQYALNNIDEYS